MRPFNPFCGTVSNAQLLTLPATIRISANGVLTSQLSFWPPASRSPTEVAGSSDSRPATAQPPLPAPTTTKSNVSVTNVPPVISSCRARDRRRSGSPLPPPLAGEGWGGGEASNTVLLVIPPPPTPPRKRRGAADRPCDD